MKRLILSTILTMLFAPLAFSQSTDDFHRFEVFVGYSHLYLLSDQVPVLEKTEDGNHVTFKGYKSSSRLLKGFDVSGTANLQRYFGLQFDFSRHSDTRDSLVEVRPSSVEQVPLTMSIYKYLGGVQLKDNSKEKRFKPFAHLLAGTSVTKGDDTMRVFPANQPQNFNTLIVQGSTSRYSVVMGGGLDVKMTDKMDLRAIQLDYNQANGGIDKSIRLGVGVVFH